MALASAFDDLRAARPLAGIGVVEVGGDVAVRYCGRLFARLGASVLRVEGGRHDVEPNLTTWLGQRKTDAPSLEAALAALEGPQIEHRLVIAGQTRAEIAEAAAQLDGRDATLLAISWFDPRGPYADWRANDAIMQAMSGIAFLFGEVEGPPTLPQGTAPQIMGAVNGFIAGLASTFDRTRRTRLIETSIFESSICLTETAAISCAALGFEVQRLGVNKYSPTCPARFYRTSDGWAGVTALTLAQWSALAHLIGRPDLAIDPDFATSLQRLAISEAVDAAIAPAFASKPTDYWVGRGDALHIPIAPAAPPIELPEEPHWRERGSFEPMPGGGSAPSLPWRFTFDREAKPRPLGGPAGPLDGVRVADFSMGWAGPLGARHLADLGADVLKIEAREKFDWWRGWDPYPDTFPPPYELPLNFMCVNRSKRGLDLDLSDPQDRRAAEEIIRACDVVMDNQGPGVMAKLGLAPADQRRLNPAVISLTMPPFGRTGRLAGLRAYGSTVEQASGMPFANGEDGWGPAQQHVAYGDPVAGLYAAAGALVGLYARERLGGSDIELCQVECLFQLGAAPIIAEQAAGRRLPQTGSRRADASPCCVVPALGHEAWLAFAVDSDAGWQALATAIGRPDLAADPALATLAGRKAREGEIEAALTAWARDKEARGAASALQTAGVAAAPVLAMHDLFADPHLQECGYWAVQHRLYVEDHFTPQPPYRYDGERPPVIRPAPVLGEHTEEVLAELGIVRHAG
ncbi:MAG TPA: CoA transferase [Caulobacteraceae bacterium]|nr:CoA transferase [Caulobacteraceae bacterium]